MQEALGAMLGRLLPGVLATLLFWVIIAVGFILILIPGFYLLGVLCLWPACLFIAGAGPVRSLTMSSELISGYWWRTTTILTMAFILLMVVSWVVGGVVGAVVGLFSRDVVSLQLALQGVVVVVTMFTLPMMPAVLVAIYRDLNLRREGSDLAARLGALGPS
jgi:hypothetical protein